MKIDKINKTKNISLQSRMNFTCDTTIYIYSIFYFQESTCGGSINQFNHQFLILRIAMFSKRTAV